MATWSTAIPLRGAPGAQLRYGTGSPGSTNPSVQHDGDAYLDLATGNLYAVRSNGIWPSSPSTNIVGATGPASIVAVNAPPGPNVGVVGGYAIWNNSGTILLYGPKTVNGWTQTAPDAQGNTLPVSIQLTGIAGFSVLSGAGAPNNSIGVVGNPAYIDTAAGNLYGAKTSSGWPASFLSLIGQTGAQGLSLLSGSGAPASSLGVVGQVYIDTQNSALYPAKTSSGWTAAPVSLVGAAGLALLSGSGAPASGLGAVGQVYLDTAAGALYAAKTGSGWPTPPLSLIGQPGQQGQQGPMGLSILFGSGAPSAAQAVLNTPGYIDVLNKLLYPPVTTAGTWGSPTSLYAPQILLTSGPPQSNQGNPLDIAIDQVSGFVYGPKSASTGWPATPIVSTVGPAGPKGDKGTAATLPNDYTGNSFVVQPVAGDTNAVRFAILNSSGTVLWQADASGNQTVTNLTATGPATLAAVSATNISASGTLSVTGVSTLAAISATSINATGTLTVSGQANMATINATASTATVKNLTLTSGGGGQVTFADGTTMTTAATASAGASGSRFPIYAGAFYSTNAAAASYYTLEDTQSNDAGLTASPAVIHTFWKVPFGFSLTGWSVNQYVNNGAQTFQVTKNRTAATGINGIVTQSAGTATVSGFAGNQFSGTWAKGTYNFAAGDTIGVVYQHATGTSTNVRMMLYGEWT